MNTPLRLNLGCGSVILSGFVNVDAHAACDLKDDIRTLEHIQTGSVDEIMADHCLEHIGQREVRGTLQAWCRVLKPGGLLTIGVPDIYGMASALLASCKRDDHRIDYRIRCIYGNQSGPGEFHQSGFTADILRTHLREVGLIDIHVELCESHGAPSLIATASKRVK